MARMEKKGSNSHVNAIQENHFLEAIEILSQFVYLTKAFHFTDVDEKQSLYQMSKFKTISWHETRVENKLYLPFHFFMLRLLEKFKFLRHCYRNFSIFFWKLPAFKQINSAKVLLPFQKFFNICKTRKNSFLDRQCSWQALKTSRENYKSIIKFI